MIIDRRQALAAMAAAAVVRAFGRNLSLSHSATAPGRSFGSVGAELVDTGEDRAIQDLSQIEAHVYSEEGIPMFLGCENTVAIGVSPPIHTRAADLNRKVAAAFERCVREWSRLNPQASADDAAKLVEFLAGRDLTSGGSETSL